VNRKIGEWSSGSSYVVLPDEGQQGCQRHRLLRYEGVRGLLDPRLAGTIAFGGQRQAGTAGQSRQNLLSIPRLCENPGSGLLNGARWVLVGA
jgi:hypothetical protein